MNGKNAGIAALLTRRGQHLVERGLHLLEPIAEGDLTRKRDDVALLQLVCNPWLPEECRLDDARIVHSVDFDNQHAWLGTLETDAIDRHDDGRVAAHIRASDLGHIGKIEVSAWHVKKEVAHAGNAQTLERLAPRS
jgi:hypothetical protein